MGRSTATVQTAPRAAKVETRPQTKEGHRDTVEAIVVAFILALVVRGFEAQAFVIPTGSMAPTLMGRHKEIACPQCGFTFTPSMPRRKPRFRSPPHKRLLGALRELPVSGDCTWNDAPSFKGDRILVMMFPYDLPFLPGSGPPSAGMSSCFGIPKSRKSVTSSDWSGCQARRSGSITATFSSRAPGASNFTQARKPMRHQAATQINVYDDRYRPRALRGKAEWQRWRSGHGLEDRPIRRVSRYQSEAGPTDEWVGVTLSSSRARSRAMGRDPGRPDAAAGAARDADHRLLLVQHQHDGGLLQLARRRAAQHTKAHGCSHTGLAI